MWDLRPGIKPMSPALAGGFLTTRPPGFYELVFITWFKIKIILLKRYIDFSLPHLPHALCVPCPLLLLVSVYTSCVTVYTYRQNLESACWRWILSPPLLAVTSYWTSVCFHHSQVNIINVRAHELIQFIFPTELYSQGQELKQEV